MSTTAELNTLNWKHQAVPGFEYYDSQMDRHYIGQPDGTIRLKTQSGGGGSIGSFTSVTANSLSPLFTVSVINPTTTADILFSQIPIGPNLVFAGPPGGGNANPTFRPLVLADLPGGGVAGSGTLNYIPKWTPNGFILGDSNLVDDGTNIMLQSSKFITSQDPTKIHLDFGPLGGEYFQLTTDGGSGATPNIYLDLTNAFFICAYNGYMGITKSGSDTNIGLVATNQITLDSQTINIGSVLVDTINIGVGGIPKVIKIGTNVSDSTVIRSYLQYVDGNQASGKVLTSDASGNATWQVGGGSGASLTATYIGYGSGANALTGDANLTWDSGNKVLLNKGTGIFGDVGGVYNYSMGSGIGTLGFNSFGYLAGVTGYGALMQLAPSTGTFTMFLESNVSAGNPHAHTTTLEWDNTGVVRIPVGLLLGTSTSGLGNAGFYGSTSGLVTIQPAAIAGTWTFTLPTTGGTNLYFLQTNGSGTTTWANLATYTWMLNGNTVGSLKYIGTNDAFSFPININGGEVARFIYSATAELNGNLGINITTPTAKVHIKPSGTFDKTTYSLKVQNGSDNALYVRGDGMIQCGGGVGADVDGPPIDGSTLTFGDKSIQAWGSLVLSLNPSGGDVRVSGNNFRFSDTSLFTQKVTSGIDHYLIERSSNSNFIFQLADSGYLPVFNMYDASGMSSVLKISLNTDPVYPSYINAGNFGLGTATPDTSAKLDIVSISGGLGLPSMTTTQKNAISTPRAGLMVYDSTLGKASLYTGAVWETVTSV